MALNVETEDVTLNVILNKDPGRRTELIGRWSIDIGAAKKTQTPTNKMMIDRYRCGPDSNCTQTDRKMVNRYRCGPNSN